MEGRLSALVFQDVEEPSRGGSLFYELQSMYTTDDHASITTIRTSKVKGALNEFYIHLGDVRGNLHILRGTGADYSSYKLVKAI